MSDRSDPALNALEKHIKATLPLLRGIHGELKRANDMRDAWATQIYELLKTAKEESE